MLKKLIYIIIISQSLQVDAVAQSITWFRTYGGPALEESWAIIQTPDNGYIFAGRKAVIGLIATRVNAYGDTIWNRTFPGNSGIEIIKTNDNNYIILGLKGITKIDINGNIIWTKGPYDPNMWLLGVKETDNGSFVICCEKEFGNFVLPTLLKTDSNGDLIWLSTYSSNIGEGTFRDITISEDNNYVLIGHYGLFPYSQEDKLFIMKTDTQGTLISFHGFDTIQYYHANFIHELNNETYIIGGGGPKLIKVDLTGTIYWYRYFFVPEYAGSSATINTIDGGYALTGGIDTVGTLIELCAFLLKTDSNGIEQFSRFYLFSQNEYDVGTSIKQTSDSGFIISGIRYGQNFDDIIVIKTDKLGNTNIIGIEPISSTIPSIHKIYQNYPNPFNSSTIIKFDIAKYSKVNLTIYDILGRELTELVNDFLKPGKYELDFKTSDFASGIYFYKIEVLDPSLRSGQDYTETKKMVLLK